MNTPSPLPEIADYRKAGGITFLAGHVAEFPPTTDRPGSFLEEARQVFENVKTTMHDAGGTLEDIISVRAYLTDFENFAEFNQVWAEYFPLNPPTRATVTAGLAAPFRLEIEAVAEI